MKKEDLRIVYMGTPDFAVASLQALVEGGYRVVGVVTMPDKPAGRGMKLQSSPVKQYALSVGLPLLQPERLKDESFLESLAAWKADLQIVVAFRMLPEVVWNMPPLGTFNLHASLLPQYRGAAPINRAIMNGESLSGVTTFFLTHEIDTGAIIEQRTVPIAPNDTAGILHDRLMEVGATLVVDTVDQILEETCKRVMQESLFAEESELKNAPKIFKEDCRIDWNQPAERVHNHIRGLSPYPAAWTLLQLNSGEPLAVKLFKSEIDPSFNSTFKAQPGTIFCNGKSLHIACKEGYVKILSLQLSGKKRLDTEAFLRGFSFSPDARCIE